MITMTTTTSSDSSYGGLRRSVAVLTAVVAAVLLLTLLCYTGINPGFLPSPHRKLLAPTNAAKPTRIWDDPKCSEADLVIIQSPDAPLSSGIPTYTVEITNQCASGCDISHIHLRCGWFSSALFIDPMVFRRVRYNDCVVNAGRVLEYGETFSFQYADIIDYPLAISSMRCR